MKKKGRPLLASKWQCTGCLVCVDECKSGSLKKVVGKDGHIYVDCNLTTCTGCNLCTNVCPIASNFGYSTNKKRATPYAAWAENDELRMRSTSGGVFAAIAKSILVKGGSVVGAAMFGNKVRHILIECVEDLHLLQGAKYLQSDTEGIYSHVKSKLKNGETVLFSGTPCQVAGLFNFMKGKKHKGLLFTIDLICAGVPSPLLVNTFLKKYSQSISSIISFRNKDNGWKDAHCVISAFNNRNEKITLLKPESSLLQDGLLSGITVRYCCSKCNFIGTYRESDLTLGDFWGDKDNPEEHFKGVSLVITHSDRGLMLLESSKVKFRVSTWEKCIPGNPRLVFGKRLFGQIRFERLFISFIFKTASYSTLEKIYAGAIPRGNILWFPYKMFRFLLYLVDSYVARKRICSIVQELKNNNYEG